MPNTYILDDSEVEHILYLLQSEVGGANCTDHGFAWNEHELTVCKRIQLKLEDQQRMWKIMTNGKDMVNDIVSAAIDRGIK